MATTPGPHFASGSEPVVTVTVTVEDVSRTATLRTPSQGACPYANVCETCDNFVAGLDRQPQRAALGRDQLERHLAG